MSKTPRWINKPEGATWGDWGADDQLGRLNLLTQKKVKEGLAEAKEGLTFCLSLPLDYPGGNVLNPRRHPPVLRPTVRPDKPNWMYKVGDDDPGRVDVINDDAAIIHLRRRKGPQVSGLETSVSINICEREGDMGVITPFRYSGLLFALVIGWVVWSDIPNPLAQAGIVLLVAAGVTMLRGVSQR